MAKNVFVVTSLKRYFDVRDPHIVNSDSRGDDDSNLQRKVRRLPRRPTQAILGIGVRFRETHAIVAELIPGQPMYSHFCGSGDAVTEDGASVMLATGLMVPKLAYLGLSMPGFLPWVFLSRLPEDAILFADDQLMSALRFVSYEGAVYIIDVEHQAIETVY